MAIAETQVRYNGSRLIPAPFVTIPQEIFNTVDGERLGNTFVFQIRGTTLFWKGSPNSSGTFHTSDGYPADESLNENQRLASLLHKQDAIRKLFSENGKALVFQPADATNPMFCNPIIKNIEFSEGPWTDKFDYTITVEADKIYAAVTSLQDDTGSRVSDAGETWAIAPGNTTGTFTLEHGLNARGYPVFTTGGTLSQPGWVTAKLWCSGRMGYDSTAIPSSFLTLTNIKAWNPVRNENYDETQGTYSIQENWLLAPSTISGIDDYTGSYSIVPDDAFTSVSVSIRGTVQGLYETLNDFTTRFNNASSTFSGTVLGLCYPRASAVFPAALLNTNPTTKSVDYNFNEGIVSYDLTYDDRVYTSGTQEEYSIEIQRGQDQFVTASIQGTIFGRLLDGEHTLATKFTKALAQWAVVETSLYTRVTSYAPIQETPVSKNVVRNPVAGTIQYNVEFNTRDNNLYLDNYNVNLRYDINSGRKNVSVNGSVIGMITVETGGWNNKFANATSGWNVVSTSIHIRASNVLSSVKVKPVSVNVDRNYQEGAISYAYEFNDRPVNNHYEEYTLQLNTTRRDGISTCSIQGTILGIMDETEDESDKYDLAMSGYSSVTGSFFTRISSFAQSVYPSSSGFVNRPLTVSVGGNPQAGSVVYNYEYDNVPAPTITGALSQVITIQDSWARDIFGNIPIPFNSSGPILQDISSMTEKRRTVNLEAVFQIGYPRPPVTSIDVYIEVPTTGVKFIDENTETWSSSTGRYTRTLSWTYTTSGYYSG